MKHSLVQLNSWMMACGCGENYVNCLKYLIITGIWRRDHHGFHFFFNFIFHVLNDQVPFEVE
jgi:hypothetical protein